MSDDIDTPAKLVQLDITEQHRTQFNREAFGIDNSGRVIDESKTHKSESKCLTQEEWSAIVDSLSKWKVESQIEDEMEKQQYLAFRKEHFDEWKSEKDTFYKWNKKYAVEEGQLASGDAVKRLVRIEPNRRAKKNASTGNSDTQESAGPHRLVVPILQIFDVLNEAHNVGHLGTERTYTNVSEKYYSVTQGMVSIFVAGCYHCGQKQPAIKAAKGAKKPIVSHEFRDRFQIDLIDMRKKKIKNIYGVYQRWIMTLKDHATGITYIRSLPFKKAEYVAHEVDFIFGYIGCPHIFHSDNGKEFVAKMILDLLKELDPKIASVTGRPRTPRDQGSVESMNKLIKQVLANIESEMRLQGRDPNWTNLLGRVMSVVNNQRGRGRYAETAYRAVFGQDYELPVRSKCSTIEERLRDNVDSRLEAVAKECCYMEGEGVNGMADGTADFWDDDDSFTLVDPEDIVDDAKEETEMSENEANTMLLSIFDSEGNDVGAAEGGGVTSATEGDGVTGGGVSGAAEADGVTGGGGGMTVALEGNRLNDGVARGNAVVATHDDSTNSTVKAGNVAALKTTVVAEMSKKSDDTNLNKLAATNKALPSTQNYESPPPITKVRKMYPVDKAWQTGKLVKTKSKGGRSGGRRSNYAKEYDFVIPTLTCASCCWSNSCLIPVGDKSYQDDCVNTKRWWDTDFITAFAQLVSHESHLVTYLPNEVLRLKTQLIHCPFPDTTPEESSCKDLEDGTERIVSVAHDVDHYSTLEIGIITKTVVVHDGLKRSLTHWQKHIVNILKRCKLIPREAELKLVKKVDPHWEKYELIPNQDETQVDSDRIWVIQDNPSIRQQDTYNCGPIACMQIMKMFNCVETRMMDDETSKIGYYRETVMSKFESLVKKFNDELVVSIPVEFVDLITPTKEDATKSTSLSDTSSPEVDCFCYDSQYHLETIEIPCCKQKVHAVCLGKSVENNAMCPYCRTLLDTKLLSKVNLALESLRHKPTLEGKSNTADAPGSSRHHHLASANRREAMENKRRHQKQQGERMKKMRNDDIKNKGLAPGAVVTIRVDARAVSHARGIIGVVARVKSETGGVLVVCECGLICAAEQLKDYWIPYDNYSIKAAADDMYALPEKLYNVRSQIVSGEFDVGKCNRVTIQKAHQLIIGANSPCVRKSCGCANGVCTGRCGCRQSKQKCHSGCSCNGNCKPVGK